MMPSKYQSRSVRPGRWRSATVLAALLLGACATAPDDPHAKTKKGAMIGAAGGLGPMLPMLLMIAPLFLLMWWMSRSQSKRQEKGLAELKKGDRVLTQSGLVGKLLELGDRYAKVEIAVARGRKRYDKRHAIAERESKRDTDRALGRRSKGSD